MSLQAITVTLNPAIDQTIQLEHLQPGAVHRASSVRNDAGGKGINVAACLADWGSQVAALGVLGVGNAGVFEALFRERGIADHCQRVAGETRTNLKLVDARSNDTTDINLPGLRLGQPHLQGVADHLAPLLRPGLPVVLSGSLPAGLPDDSWAQLQAQASGTGARVLLDTSGMPLVTALNAAREALPYAVKPNRYELEAWTGRPLNDRAALSAAAHELIARGVQLVVISMGTDGALFVQRDQRLIARPPRLAHGSSVGAGDAMVAGLAAALLDDATTLEQCARLATAFSMCRLESGDARRMTPEGVHRAATDVAIEALS
ncbi:1-phosphofructokinase [Xanthomonas oryzae]|uniref:Phosphofructokinase n=1 Tax=Xanthomonas oryzae TaxID=347 RepID=A0AAP1EVJ1_9XANT|nr:1-phosphofructokinase [Xanthomonas oryzae]KOR40383.1 1-phosphofructokinase [Xanthomonas oryzae]QBG84057.1 1-phosphofructokinase [Xanthomonas oryzae]